MTENERVREVRKSQNLTLETFGTRLGVGRAAISNIERGQRNVTEQMRKAICREFNINYNWLVYGEGEMISNLPHSILSDICTAYNCDDDDLKLIEAYLESDPDVRAAIKQYIKRVMGK
ncbi:MAG: helix-turn-helix domain-containing protein [Allobaculum sp.]|nr:helix-turn-helix domain-containing protein [Allobaculum sp.]